VTALVNWAKNVYRVGDVALFVVILLIGAILLFARPRWGRRWMLATVLVYWWVGTPLGSALLSAPLTRGFHALQDPAEAGSVGAIVVLGGGIEEFKAASLALAYPSEPSSLRVLEGARLFRLLGGLPLVVPSGGTPVAGQQTAEGDTMAEALISLHVPRDRIVVEDVSMTTYEQAFNVTRLLKLRGIDRFVLITSPTHMRRAVAVFRAQHADVVPSVAAPFRERSWKPPFFIPNEDSLHLTRDAVYDYTAMVYYWARGRFRPAPRFEGS
jgi:uncharacterized SAM-binding protein YcdF (DUF218 family)